jgi:hypothetical protein
MLITDKDARRFMAGVLKTFDEDSCWEWLKGKNVGGYGKISIGGRPQAAHRISYILFCGDIPEGLIVRHRCDNPGCVRPSHLEVGDHMDNSDDRRERLIVWNGARRMPRRNDLKSFGPEFEALLVRADRKIREGNPEMELEFVEQKVAENIKCRMYAYFKALRNSPDRLDLTLLAEGIGMRVEGKTLHLYRKGEEKATLALREALGMEHLMPIEAPSTLDNNRELLRQLRQPKT